MRNEQWSYREITKYKTDATPTPKKNGFNTTLFPGGPPPQYCSDKPIFSGKKGGQ
jgi:hypothetical protein